MADYGEYTILHQVTNRGKHRYMLCRCSCGTEKEVRLSHLTSGKIVSCGCFNKKLLTTQQGESKTRLYKVWINMLDRCNNPACDAYPRYGGRGIAVHLSWGDFQVFKLWANASGYSSMMTIERSDVDLGYCPSNCTWVTKQEQAVNRRKQLGTSSAYIGVFPIGPSWRAAVTYKRKTMQVGMYPTELEAAQARDNYITQNGLPHKLNF